MVCAQQIASLRQLTPDEMDVLRLSAEGRNSKEIGELNSVSSTTARKRLERARDKLPQHIRDAYDAAVARRRGPKRIVRPLQLSLVQSI